LGAPEATALRVLFSAAIETAAPTLDTRHARTTNTYPTRAICRLYAQALRPSALRQLGVKVALP
jgi:hypothetical protein